MTHPPHGGDEPGPDDAADPGSSPLDPDRFPTVPAPSVGPGSPERPYGQNPPHPGPPQPYGPPANGSHSYGQPQQYGLASEPPRYGLPGQQFGPPPAAPAQKSAVGVIVVLTLVALVVIAAVVVLVRATESTVLDASSADRDVAAQFQQREGVAIDLTCPADMAVRTGATYTCTGKTADGEAVTLRLAITDAKTAAYTWTEP